MVTGRREERRRQCSGWRAGSISVIDIPPGWSERWLSPLRRRKDCREEEEEEEDCGSIEAPPGRLLAGREEDGLG